MVIVHSYVSLPEGNGCWLLFFGSVISMIFPGEMRTVAGNGTEPVRNVDEWEEPPLGRNGPLLGVGMWR